MADDDLELEDYPPVSGAASSAPPRVEDTASLYPPLASAPKYIAPTEAPAIDSGGGQPPVMPLGPRPQPSLNRDVMSGAVAPPSALDEAYQPIKPSTKSTIMNRIAAGMLGFHSPEAGVRARHNFEQAPIDQANQNLAHDTAEYNNAATQGLHQQNEAREEAGTAAQIRNIDSEIKARENPQVKGTPEEQFMHDALNGGPNGGPKLDKSGKPYTYLSAHQDWKQAEQDTKPEKPDSAAQDDQKYESIIQKQKLGQKATPEDQAFVGAYEKRKTLVPATNFNLNQPGKETARSDKSFQYNQGALDKARAPVDALAQRFSRLQDTLNQGNPQADALVAPELLSVMAGGVGSGVRMNEAEIARIVGGRSAWENLKAAMQHWSTNPADARSITPEQDKQIRALIQTVGQKVTAKQAALEEAQNHLLDSDDPKEHRRIVSDARAKLDAIDAGQQENNSQVRVQQNSKGEFRHSTDGGKTWQMGKPPQPPQ